jgi:mono/diheme cytochrome c family protein
MSATGVLRRGRGRLALVFGVACLAGAGLGLRAVQLLPPATGAGPLAAAAEPAPADRLAEGKRLYTIHCAMCHGENGDGTGLAGRFLYPRPRNFGEAKFRLASTANGIPTDQDLLNIITRGMPGSAMFPFGHLPEGERQALAAYVRVLTRSAFIQAVRQESEAQGQKVDLAELERDADEVLKPGDPVAVPDPWPRADAASVARGKATYLAKGCASCHGETGKGDGVQEQKNNDGTPTAPRDFTRGIFKGGREQQHLYARIALGMPGTPMPGSQGVPPEEIADQVNFILSMSTPDAQAQVEHRRHTVTARRVSGPLPEAIPESVWAAVPPARVVVSPLWWRNYAEPELAVRAVHDGRALAFRLSWRDDTRNDHIGKPEEFEDMAAVQLFAGPAEPFLGMGAEGSQLDLWLWRSSWQRPPGATYESLLDDYPFESAVYQGRVKAGDRPPPNFATARAAGNPHAHADAAQSASSLTAKGFGSTTFRPKASQAVAARSDYKEGRWTVELRRPLAVGPDGGITLAPGGRGSVAFALWDGAARDRNGQKLVSVWHDLKLED